MADIQISPSGWTSIATSLANRPCVWVTDLIGYVFFYRSDDALRGSLFFLKTTDGGLTWTEMPIEGNIRALVSDGTYIYAGCSQAPAVVVKIDPATMTAVDVWVGTAAQQYCAALAYDGTYIYMGGFNASGVAIVVQINPATMATVLTWTGTAAQLYCQAVVAFGGFIYAGTGTTPAYVIKINPATMTTAGAPNTWTGAAGQDNCYALTADATYIYAGLVTTAAIVVQINPATMATVLTWTGAAGQNNCDALTADATYIYAGLLTSPPQVVQINPATMATVLTWTGAAGYRCATLVSDGTYIYAGLRLPVVIARVVQINPATMATVATWNGAAGQNDCYALTRIGAYVYAGLGTSPAQVVKITSATMITFATWTGTNQKVNSEAVAANVAYGFSCWFDQWTPNDTGTKIHISWVNRSGATALLKYNYLDTATDTLGTERSTNTGVAGTAASYVTGITKSRGGNLYSLVRWDGGNQFYRSVDGGVTWVARTAPTVINPTVQPHLTPGNEADTQDIYGVWNVSTNFNLYWYDDSANTWTTTTMLTVAAGFDGGSTYSSIRKSDNYTITVIKAVNGANRDLKALEISNGITSASLTNVYTNEANHTNGGVGILITTTGTIYVDYEGIVAAANAVAYRKSTDAGVTWSAEVRLDTAAAASVCIGLSLNQTPSGTRVYGMWNTATTIMGNYGTSLPLLAGGGMTGLQPALMELMLA